MCLNSTSSPTAKAVASTSCAGRRTGTHVQVLRSRQVNVLRVVFATCTVGRAEPSRDCVSPALRYGQRGKSRSSSLILEVEHELRGTSGSHLGENRMVHQRPCAAEFIHTEPRATDAVGALPAAFACSALEARAEVRDSTLRASTPIVTTHMSPRDLRKGAMLIRDTTTMRLEDRTWCIWMSYQSGTSHHHSKAVQDIVPKAAGFAGRARWMCVPNKCPLGSTRRALE